MQTQQPLDFSKDERALDILHRIKELQVRLEKLVANCKER